MIVGFDLGLALHGLATIYTKRVFYLVVSSMPESDASKAFHFAVYSAVADIPYGKVTSYGHIGYLIGRPQNARQVGLALKHIQIMYPIVQDDSLPPLDALPWWRVISSAGVISKRDFGEYEQARRLRAEEVPVLESHHVDLDEYGWFPDGLD